MCYLISLIGLFVAAFIRILPSFNRLIAVRHNLQYNFYVVNTLFDQYERFKTSIMIAQLILKKLKIVKY